MLGQAGEQLKLIANFGAGVDNIDVTAALKRGVTVTNTPGVLTEDTADMTMALILAIRAAHRLEGAGRLAEGQWSGWSPTWMLGAASPASGSASSAWAASGRRWRAARARSACRSTITTAAASRRLIEEALEATYWDSLDQMLARMDFVSINCPHTPATFHLLSAPRLRRLRKEAILVNTARGEIVDEAALITHVGGGRTRRRRARRVRARAGGLRQTARAGQSPARRRCCRT